MSLFRYISIARKVYREIQIQKKYNKAFLIPYLDELEQKHGGEFGPEQKQKIVGYYGLFITSFLCSSYKRLYGKVLSSDERKRATLFGILTPVGDDLFDIDKLSIEAIRAITFRPDEYQATTFTSKVAKEIQSYLLQHVPYRNQYLEASRNVLDIQVETMRQTDPRITNDELQRITYTKGAVSVIIYHEAMDENASREMLEVLYYIGSLFQLGNDIFDLYKDVRDNIFTLINTCTDFKVYRQEFLQRVREQNRKIMDLPYGEQNKKEFCIVMNTINARSLVALDQFSRMQNELNGKINWWQSERKDMIVDMEKPKNFAKWLYYIWKLPRML